MRRVASAKADRRGCFGKEESFDLSPALWEEGRKGEEEFYAAGSKAQALRPE